MCAVVKGPSPDTNLEAGPNAVFGSTANPPSAAMAGVNTSNNARGRLGCNDEQFNQPAGVYGESDHQGVLGHANSDAGTGVFGNTTGGGFGVRGETITGVALQGQSSGTGLAGKFIGDVEVTGDIRLVNADVAEEFEVSSESDQIEPGMVTVFDSAGALRASGEPYDRRVAGVVAGAGDLKPGVILGRQDGARGRVPLALVGRAFCNVDAEYGPVAVGDLLTTSLTRGHAMKATDSTRAFGAVLGKALRPLPHGRGAIPILIAMQ